MISGYRAKVLVIDDDYELHSNLKDFLELYHFGVAVAPDGVEALALLKKEIPDIIVCDIVMPGMDGNTFLSIIQAQDEYRQIPLIYMTGITDPEEKLYGLQRGAIDYLIKPFIPEELLYKINNIIQLRKGPDRVKTAGEAEEPEAVVFKIQFEEILKQSYHNVSLSPDDIAEKVNMSVSALQRKIMRYYQSNFSLVVKQYRLQKARLLLARSDRSVDEVARMCGFSSASYFSRIFKENSRLSPVQYRLQQLGKG